MLAGTRNETGGAETEVSRPGRGRAAARWCPACGEELSDKFGFCPMDGTPLSRTRRDTKREDLRLAMIEQRVLPVRLFAALFEAARARARARRSGGPAAGLSPDTQAADGGAGHTGQRPGMPHFTVPEEVGLTRRLARALSEFAEGSRLTWPEFQRDPAAFIRRAVGALRELGLIPFMRGSGSAQGTVNLTSRTDRTDER